MKFKLIPEQFNSLFEVVALSDAGVEQFTKKEHDGVVKMSENGVPVYRVPNVVLKDKATGRIDKNASIAVENPSALAALTAYGATGKTWAVVTTYVGPSGWEALSITLPELTDSPNEITSERVRDVLRQLIDKQGKREGE